MLSVIEFVWNRNSSELTVVDLDSGEGMCISIHIDVLESSMNLAMKIIWIKYL